jgi:hypothetical protein
VIEYTQQNLDDYKGSCYATCIASILEVPLESVPNFVEHGYKMHDVAREWLKERGWTIQMIYVPNDEWLKKMFFELNDYCIVSGLSPRRTAKGEEKHHAVVGRLGGWGLTILHDPHPSRDGLMPGKRWIYILRRHHN